jgi:hypothetical protein
VYVVQNWEQWNLTIGPLTGSATTNLTNRIFYILPKALCEKVSLELVADWPKRPPLFPSDSLCFGICRSIEDNTLWAEPQFCTKEIKTAQDLANVYTVSINVLLDYSLLPRSIGHRALTLISGGNALRGMLGYDNTQEHNRELKRQARQEVAQSKVTTDLSQIDVDEEAVGDEPEEKEEKLNITDLVDVMETE